MDKDKYIRQLEEALRKFLEPVRDIPYKIAIKALTGCKEEEPRIIEKINRGFTNSSQKC